MSQSIPSTDPYISLINGSKSGIFRPWYTPKEMLLLGVFGGSFFTDRRALMKTLSWDLITDVPVAKLISGPYDPAQNYFNVTLELMDRTFEMPMTMKRLHPNGWFEWYCRFYYGEQSPADPDRIRQWLMSVNQHWFYITNGTYNGDGNINTDVTFLPERRQRLLELGVDPTIPPSVYNCFYKF